MQRRFVFQKTHDGHNVALAHISIKRSELTDDLNMIRVEIDFFMSLAQCGIECALATV